MNPSNKHVFAWLPQPLSVFVDDRSLMSSLMSSLASFEATKSIEISQSFSAAAISLCTVSLTLWSHTQTFPQPSFRSRPSGPQLTKSEKGGGCNLRLETYPKIPHFCVKNVFKPWKPWWKMHPVYKPIWRDCVYLPSIWQDCWSWDLGFAYLGHTMSYPPLQSWYHKRRHRKAKWSTVLSTEPLSNSQPDWLLISFVVLCFSQASYLHAQTDCAEERPVAIWKAKWTLDALLHGDGFWFWMKALCSWGVSTVKQLCLCAAHIYIAGMLIRYMHVCVCRYVYIYIYVYICASAFIYIHTNIYIYTYVCVCVCAYVSISSYKYT